MRLGARWSFLLLAWAVFWAARGYVVVYIQHPGSNDSVWTDVAPVGHQDVASRLAVYDNLTGVPKYEVVLNDAEHSVFTDRALPGDKEPRNPNHQRVILAVSTAFWDAYLRGDAAARAWLNSEAPRSVMEAADRWEFDAGPEE